MKVLNYISVLFILIHILSCTREGCTDELASNYDANAKKDDGSCEYLGCTDDKALNYSYSAREDDGSCEYPGSAEVFPQISHDHSGIVRTEMFHNGNYIGKVTSNCTTEEVFCGLTCPKFTLTELSTGGHSVNYVQYRIETNENGNKYNDTLHVSDPVTFNVSNNSCTPVAVK